MVRRLASQARLDLAPEEVERLAVQLSGILEQMDALTELGTAAEGDVDERDPSVTAAGLLRSDDAAPDALIGTLSRFAPEVHEGFFTVPVLPTHAVSRDASGSGSPTGPGHS